jgi:protein tyrosine/serine phosphatase
MSYDLNDPNDYKRAMSDYLWKDHGVLRLKYSNLHPVGGDMWRCNQPSPNRIKVLKDMGFKTILNVRGTQPNACFYALERHTCDELGLEMVDLPFGSREAPYLDRMERLFEIFETIEYPAVIHCKSGSDRAGIISVLYKLVHEKVSIEEAMTHLSFKFGHIKAGKTGMLDFFFEAYRADNEETPIEFMDWVRTKYDRESVHNGFMASWWGSLLTEKLLKRE